MMNRRPSCRRLVAGLLALALLALPGFPAAGQFAVYDAANHVSNLTQAARALSAILQRIEQIRALYDQLAWMAAQIEELEDPSIREIWVLLHHVELIVDQGEALTYVVDDFRHRYRDLYEGYQVPEDLVEASREQVDVALDTFLASMLATQRIADEHLPSQEELGELTGQLLRAEGAREVAQAAALIDSYSAQETAKVLQQLQLLTNVETVFYSHVLNREAMGEEAFSDALAEAYRPGLRYRADSAPSLVSASYPSR